MTREFDILQKIEYQKSTIIEALQRGVAHDEKGYSMIMPDKRSLEKEMMERRLRIYLGIDPTSPELHIGHTVPLRKLRQFQDLGHEVILLFGTFTGRIGDPTDKSAARVKLTKEQVEENIKSYALQASKILDLSKNAKNPIRIVQNHEWLAPLTFEQVIDLASNMTIQQLLERSMFKNRLEQQKPIHSHEILYPLMQGYDSVALETDIETGGKDQIFNMMVGRDFVKTYLGKEKWVLPTQLIEDPSGKKMGKTEGNLVNIRDLPEVKYEGLMTWPDSAIAVGLELITWVPMETVEIIKEQLVKGQIHPMDTKEAFAWRVVAELDGIKEANFAQKEFNRVKRQGLLPRRMVKTQIIAGTEVLELLVSSGLASDENDALRKIAQRSIFIDGKMVNKNTMVPQSAQTISIGKKTIKNIRQIIFV